MTRLVLRSIPIAAALAVLCAAAPAQTSTPAGSGTSMTGGQAAPAAQAGTGTRNTETRKDDQLARADRKFIQQAAEGGMFEVEVAQLAASKAADPNVKAFADTLLKAHQAANNELVQIANSRKVELSAAPPRAKRRDVEKLARLTGKAFDERFVREVGIKDHEKDIRMFEKGSASVKDAQLKAWIDKTLPHLREHLAMAQKLPQAGRGGADASSMGNRAAPKPGG
ncbi:MAG: DUF4142 domain-containing protein [Burkholderiales bacterium]|nr:DUF4142 domain-containing protein [Burkholderiales bacterium]